jgi:hypothetical protein
MNFSPKIVIPYASIISLYLYFLTYDMVLNPSFKVGRDFVFFLLVSIHTGFVLFEKQKKSNYFEGHLSIGISTIISFLSFVLRSYLDVPTRAGVSLEASPIPKIRDFLLIPIVVCALFSLIYQIFITLSKESIAAQSSSSENKRSLLQKSAYNFLLLFPILIVINYFATAKNYNFDLSSIGKFSYSETSRSIIKQLDKKVTVTAFYPRPLESSGKEESWILSAVRMELAIYLEQLSAINPRIEVKFINADVEKDLLGEFDQVSNGTIVIRTLKTGNFSGSPYIEEKIIVQNKTDLENLERKIVQAMNNLSLPSKTIYFTASNGERYSEKYSNFPDSKLTRFINSLTFFNYTTKELGFKEAWPAKIPEDADMVAIIGADVEFSKEAQESLMNYIFQRNGKVFITINPNSKEQFKWLTEKSAISFEEGRLRQVQGRPEIIANNFPDHPISSLFIKKEIGSVFPNSGYFEILKSRTNLEFKEIPILETGFTTFIDTNGNEKLDQDEKQNNFLLGVVLIPENTGEDKSKETGKVILYSGTDWISDKYIIYNLNPALASNSINWIFQKQIVDSIVSKKEDTPVITLTQNQKLFIWSVGLFGYPLSLILGLSIYVISKRKSKE